MPLFAIIAHDKPGSAGIRMATRERHLAYADGLGDRIVAGGPLVDEAGSMIGSLIIAEFDNLKAAQDFAAVDPYAEAGLFQSVEIRAWRQVFPR